MKTTSPWKKRLTYLALFFIFLALAVFSWVLIQTQDRNPDYNLNFTHQTKEAQNLKVGFGKEDISPLVLDSWTDVNGDAQYVAEDGDTYEDRNGNGKFDPVWMAGFQNQRPAQGVHDPLWARSFVIDDGEYCLAWAVLDMIGYGNDDIIEIRKRVAAEADIDYIMVSSTHTHEGPDLIGLWGESYTQSGVDPNYREAVIEKTVASILAAYQNRQKAKLHFSQDLESAIPYVTDSRKPLVLDPGLRMMHAVAVDSDSTIGTLISWSNHPETLWDKNLLISSDFPHYIREGVEKGIFHQDTLVEKGLGGIAIFANGSIGGLMTTHPTFAIKHPISGEMIKEPGYAKTEAQGMAIAQMVLKSLANPQSPPVEEAGLYVRAKTIELPLKNPLYKLAIVLGVLDRGMPSLWNMRTEISHWKIGPAEFLHHPAEIYPEIVNGGVEAPEGRDFLISPVESPSIRSYMQADIKFVMGLSNDMIGYAIPKSEWDEEAPYIYGYEDAPYGEINSLGPETAPILYREMKELLGVKEE
ncbi:MAG: neutral/alkaline non-lysosomal ceramidase N-terminal domain-containing protein [Bacteroidota bacterium]